MSDIAPARWPSNGTPLQIASAVAAIIEQLKAMTPAEAFELGRVFHEQLETPKRQAAWDAACAAALRHRRGAFFDAHSQVRYLPAFKGQWWTCGAAYSHALTATLTRDLITPEHHDLLMGAWWVVIGR